MLFRSSERRLELARVARAARSRRRSDSEYRAALEAAHAAGWTFSKIARAAGVSRQAARELLLRGKK